MSAFLDFFTNILAVDPTVQNLGTLKDFAALQTNQKAYLSSSLKSDRLNFNFDSFGNIQYSNGYVSKPIVYSPNYSDPAKSVNFMAQLYGLPASTTLELTAAANANKGNKPFLKNTLAFLGKNWQQILTGAITVATAIKYGNSGGISETDPNINPATGLPYGEVPQGDGNGGGGAFGISTSTLIIGGLGLGAVYLLLKK